jgi:hypothetical protein
MAALPIIAENVRLTSNGRMGSVTMRRDLSAALRLMQLSLAKLKSGNKKEGVSPLFLFP